MNGTLTSEPLGTPRNLTFHEWNLHFGTPRNLTFHEWNLHFGTSRNLSEPNVSWMEPSLRNRFHSFGTSRNLVQGFGRLPQTTPKLYWKNPKPFRLLGKKKKNSRLRTQDLLLPKNRPTFSSEQRGTGLWNGLEGGINVRVANKGTAFWLVLNLL